MISEQQKIDAAEFETFLQAQGSDRLFELIHGKVVEKVPTQLHGMIVAQIIYLIMRFLDDRNLDAYIGPEIRHRPEGDNYNDRLPDVSAQLDTSQPPVGQGAVLHMPDLAVEVKSPSDNDGDLLDKANFYLSNGTKLVWLVFPAEQAVEVHRREADVVWLYADDTLSGGDVLPRFEISVRNVFNTPCGM